VNPNLVLTEVDETWSDDYCTQGSVWDVAGTALPHGSGEGITLLTPGAVRVFQSRGLAPALERVKASLDLEGDKVFQPRSLVLAAVRRFVLATTSPEPAAESA
jgi:hypothetical protein